MALSDRYEPQGSEDKIYKMWEESGSFKAQLDSDKPNYTVILPPPNVTGFLHIGHALDHTIQDVLVRWKRMSGYNAFWLPGTDHAGIATQSVVEKQLYKDSKKTRRDLGRDAFVKEVWKWKNTYGERIVSQMKKLGDSCDWDRQVFTLDEGVSKAVRRVFVSLYEEGLIYRGKRLINWSPKLQTALSDIEVEHRDIKGSMWTFKYPLLGTSTFLSVATTRPETLLGDTALCVHPDDERYKKYIGQKAVVPFVNREIPIIADEYVDPEFGSGVVKITPAHDFNDYEVGLRNKLPMENIMTTSGNIVQGYGDFSGLSMQQARQLMLEKMEADDLLIETKPHNLSVGHCERSGCVAQPYLSEQWFVKMKGMADEALKAVERGDTEFVPASHEKTYNHWLSNIQDWCISRQLWWGHQIPAWTCSLCKKQIVAEIDPTSCPGCNSTKLIQDEDVLDTWFSSGLWPFSTMGWPEETDLYKKFYPTQTLVTGHDIIFFWVARMMMMGLKLTKQVPFKKVILHGLVRDSQGRKMSKSLGNSIDPLGLIEKNGADALRFTLMSLMQTGRDLKFSEQRLEGYRNFMNKIWNAARFIKQNMGESEQQTISPNITFKDLEQLNLSDYDKWIVAEFSQKIKTVIKNLDSDRLSEASLEMYKFTWNQFCDWYLEFSKTSLYGDDVKQKSVSLSVLHFVFKNTLKMLHPITPFITEELYQEMGFGSEDNLLITSDYPKSFDLSPDYLESHHKINLLKEVIFQVRQIRGENGIKASEKLNIYLDVSNSSENETLKSLKPAICKLAGVETLHFSKKDDLNKCGISMFYTSDGHKVSLVLPLEGLVDLEEEAKRIEKRLEKTEKMMTAIEKKLSNQSFIKNAPAELVEKDKENLQEYKSLMSSLKDHMQRLRS